jgi:hypothetical protein
MSTACRPATRLPGRREHPGSGSSHAEEGDYEAAWRDHDARQPAARDHGPRLLSPLRERLQPQAQSTERSASTPSSASSATRPSRAGSSPASPAADRQTRDGRRRRPRRPVRRLSSAPSRPRRRDLRGRPGRRRHDALSASRSIACRATSLEADIGNASRQHGRRARPRPHASTTSPPSDAGRRLRRRVPRHRRADRPSAPTSRPATPAHHGRHRRAARRWRPRRRSPCSAAASSSMAAATPRSTSRAPPSGWARGVHHRLPPHPQAMPAHDFEMDEALEEGVKRQVAEHHQGGRRRRRDHRREDGLDEDGKPAADRRVRDGWRPTRW